MPANENPFYFDAANTLDVDEVLSYYVDDHNYGRLIQSPRNVFLVGERGSGKSMTLIYNSFAAQQRLAQRSGTEPSFDLVGVVIPCNTPLLQAREHTLLPDEFRASVYSEHLFALTIAHGIADTLSAIVDSRLTDVPLQLAQQLEFVLGFQLPPAENIYEQLKLAVQRELTAAQVNSSNPANDIFVERAYSFGSLILPLLTTLQKVPVLRRSHFMLLVDDAQYLNSHQNRALNSWIAYRDRSLFSFKVATTKADQPPRLTSSQGSILEGHDYITVDMEGPYHNDESAFGRFATKVVAKRLGLIDVHVPPQEFFPPHRAQHKELVAIEAEMREHVSAAHSDWTDKQINDYIYKHKRPEYFKRRDPKANLPPYAGFTTLVYLSTGVVRNLLDPCFFMYDDAISANPGAPVRAIAAAVQNRVIQSRSRAAWRRLRELDKNLRGCTSESAEQVYRLFDHLARAFRERLFKHPSEPRSTSFTISMRDPEIMKRLEPLLLIARRAEMLYEREGPAKVHGKRESYYVPNRLLWPIRGLDVYGQHARAPLRAADLLAAALHDIAIPLRLSDESQADEKSVTQAEFFEDADN